MEDLDYSEEVDLEREVYEGEVIYSSKNTLFNCSGKKISQEPNTTKFETGGKGQTKYIQEQKEKEKDNQTMNMNGEFANAVYAFTENLFKELETKFDGKVVGSDEMNMDVLMKEFFGDFEPGKTPPKVKKEKKAPKEKKKRQLSGYTFFGQQNKESFNQEIKDLEKESGEKESYIKFQSKKWKELSDEEKKEWGEKAKEAFVPEVKEGEEGDQ